MTDILVEACEVSKHFTLRGPFHRRRDLVRAVDGVSLQIRRGETLALVGESGSGKTTLGRCLLQMVSLTSGRIRYEGVDATVSSAEERRRFHRTMQVIYQDPFTALNPRRTALQQVMEPIAHLTDHPQPEEAARHALSLVGLGAEQIHKYPHAFSGGQRQRIGIARAIAVRPTFILCDEPVSALDLSIQAQILSLLRQLQHDFALTYLFISHDLGVVHQIADRVAVMYGGRIAEIAPTERLFTDPQHPYTRQLLQARPVADPQRARELAQRRRAVSVSRIPPATRTLREVSPGHWVA